LPVAEPIPDLVDVLAGYSRGWTLAERRQGRLSFVTGCATSSRIEITTDKNGISLLVWDYGEAAETFTIHEAERIGGAEPRISLTVHSTERRGSGLSVLELAHVDPKAGTASWTVVQGKLGLPKSGVWVSDAAKKRYPVKTVACPKE
jgi:hypothetical protein